MQTKQATNLRDICWASNSCINIFTPRLLAREKKNGIPPKIASMKQLYKTSHFFCLFHCSMKGNKTYTCLSYEIGHSLTFECFGAFIVHMVLFGGEKRSRRVVLFIGNANAALHGYCAQSGGQDVSSPGLCFFTVKSPSAAAGSRE